jgi:cytochrome c553
MGDRAFLRRLGAGVACWMFAWASGATIAAEAPAPTKRIDFNRDIRPILADNCYACHGPDKNKRKASLRLDTKDGLFSGHDDVRTLVPGKPDESELFRRITSDEPQERMPDPNSGKSLSPAQIALIKAWIEQGAAWKGHWSYIKPVRPELPAIAEPGFVRNPVDRFILARLREAGLSPSPEADRVTLIRRLSFDLTGLPPSKAEVDAFVADRAADAYERLVDRLLASPHYGERMAMYWLDLVRYADSIGYHSDNPMQVSPYRDYVIRAFNANMPFDRFTTEQLAGDLLPGATLEQKIASAYNRLLQTTEEGGAQAKEYEAKYAADRVRNASTVWLGATMGCAQCHDHKFDPYSMRDFYRMAAYFADVQEAAVGKREPGMPVPDERQAAELKQFDDQIADLAKKLDTPTPELAAEQTEWEAKHGDEVPWDVIEAEEARVAGESSLRKEAGGVLASFGKVAAKETYTVTARVEGRKLTGFRVEALRDDALPAAGPGTAPNGNFVLTEFKVSAAAGPDGKPAPVRLRDAVSDHAQDGFPVAQAIDGNRESGWAILPAVGRSHEAVFEAAEPVGGEGVTRLTFTLEFQSPHPQHQIGRLRLSATSAPEPSSRWVPPGVRAALAIAPGDRTEAQKGEVGAYFRSVSPTLRRLRDELAAVRRRRAEFAKTLPTVLVSNAGPPRTVRMLPRGNWLDESGEVVTPATPRFLSSGSEESPGTRATRADLARWIVARDNPLTARVFVNRFWKLAFGQGLSKTLDDLGAQGEWPTHPELLDWLAVEFMDSGWDVKHMMRLLVTSGTYRQVSRPRPDLKERDPFNRLYARQSRFRLDAEMVRDNALAISGLLSRKIGGPSVKPYQPPGYWAALNFPPREWQNDTGEAVYRRGLYTHWQRTFPHPSLLAFDAPSREECTVDRPRSNIPQQALALLNDPTYVEAARAFAERILKAGGSHPADALDWAFEHSLSRRPTDEERRVLTTLLDKHARQYAADRDAARKLLGTGQHPVPADLDVADLATWTSVARVILNLHETITRD